jgi:transcriptional regulator with XRE-family HTH domain
LPVDGLELRISRLRAGLKLYELADRIGLSESALSRIETGRTQPSPELVVRITEELSVAGSPADRVPA